MNIRFGGSSPADRPSARHAGRGRMPGGASARLMMLAIMLLLILLLMAQARRPENWHWMWGGRPPAAATQPPGPDQPAAPRADPIVPAGGEKDPDPERGVRRVRQNVWQQVFSTLNADEQLRLVRQILAAARGDQNEAPLDSGLIARIDEIWQQYLQEAYQAADADSAELTAAQREQWRTNLARAGQYWSDEVRVALEQAARGESLSAEQQKELQSLTELLRDVVLARVEDTSVHRAEERVAWFWLLDALQRTSDEQLADRSLGSVLYVQLEEQPAFYRGKIVTFQGTMRLAYRLDAPPNPWGIEHYYVFWIQPPVGSSLAAVYALEPPAELAEIPDRYPGDRSLKPDLPVTVRGYFFKRMVYSSEGGPATAPLLLTKRPELRIPPAGPTVERELPSLPVVLVGVLLAGVVAAGVTWYAWRKSRPSPLASRRLVPESPPRFDELPEAQSVQESLKRLGERSSDEREQP